MDGWMDRKIDTCITDAGSDVDNEKRKELGYTRQKERKRKRER